jgi:inner membrane protein
MLGKSHRLMAAAGAVFLGAPPLCAAAAALGATLPDRIEIVGLPHRGISHWPWPWVAAVWAVQTQQHSPWSTLLAWWLAGALFHIGADLLTVGGVPLLLPNWRIRLGVLRTGSVGEYVVVALVVIAALMQVFHLQIVRAAGP